MKLEEIAVSLDKFMKIEAVSSIFCFICLMITINVVFSNSFCGYYSYTPLNLYENITFIKSMVCTYIAVVICLDLILLLVCYVCENLYEIGGSFVQTIIYGISSFYRFISEFFGMIYHHTDPVVGSTASHFIVGLCILLSVALVCYVLQKLNRNLRPKYTVPFISFNVAVALNIDGVSHNNYGVPICIVISALWLVMVNYSIEVQGRGYQRIGAATTNDDRLEEGRVLQNTRSDTGITMRTTTRTTANSSIVGEARDQRVYDAVNEGGLTRIHTVGGHDHRLFVTEDCQICMENFGETTRALPCGHCFHDKCIQDWFVKRSSHPCPICRQPSTVSGWLVKSLFQ